MTVSELIEKLHEFDGNLDVKVCSAPGEWSSVTDVDIYTERSICVSGFDYQIVLIS